MAQRIPLSRPFFDEREVEAVRRVLASGWVIQGPEVEAFEARIAALHHARHCVALSSGTAALHVAYLALGIGPGDAVFIPSFAWPSAANMARLVGARPVFVDVLTDTYNIDPDDLVRRIEECPTEVKTRAIVPVHEFGLAAAMGQIMAIAERYRLEVIEDAACALGAMHQGRPVGTVGALGIFSFHPRKSITTGEGGAIVTNSDALAGHCRLWRNHGQLLEKGRREFVLPGLNYRMTEMQAAIGQVQLDKFSGILEARRRIAAVYREGLTSPGLGLPTNDPGHTWQTFMTVLGDCLDRAQMIQALSECGIEAGAGSVAGHLGNHFRPQMSLPRSEQLHRQGLALPMFADLSVADAQRCVATVISTLERMHAT